jgi:integrase
VRLDRRFVATVVPPVDRPEATHWDDASPGLGLRVLRTGAKSWIVRYRVGRRQRFTTIGRAADLGIEKAREIAATFRAKAKLGQDPGAEVEALRDAAGDTLDRLIDGYLARHVVKRQKPRTQAETRRHLLTHWRPLHKASVPTIDRRRVARELQRIAEENGEVAANRARSALSAMFSWSIKEGLAEINPVIGTNKVAEEHSRERTLTDEELRAIWLATSGPGAFDRIVRLLMLTGCRRNEIGALAQCDIDLSAAIITIPGARSKNGHAHIVPLAEPARVIVSSMERQGGLVFSSSDNGFSGWSLSKHRLDQKIATARARAAGLEKPNTQQLGGYGLEKWRLHDLRRSVATRLADLGVEPHVIEEILGHTSGHKAGVHGIYNRSTYEPQKRAALSLWADRLMQIVGERPAVVVPLRVAR